MTHKVFISSTYQDLKEERAALLELLDQLDGVECIAMERFGARAGSAFHTSLDFVDKADLFLGLVGYRWGTGITELEYRRAIANKTNCIFFLVESPPSDMLEVQPQEDVEKLLKFRREVSDAFHGYTVRHFSSSTELCVQASIAVSNWIGDDAANVRKRDKIDVESRYREIQQSIATGRLKDGIARMMDFTNDFASSETLKDEAIVISFQYNQIGREERLGQLDSKSSIEIKTQAAGQILSLINKVLVSVSEATAQ